MKHKNEFYIEKPNPFVFINPEELDPNTIDFIAEARVRVSNDTIKVIEYIKSEFSDSDSESSDSDSESSNSGSESSNNDINLSTGRVYKYNHVDLHDLENLFLDFVSFKEGKEEESEEEEEEENLMDHFIEISQNSFNELYLDRNNKFKNKLNYKIFSLNINVTEQKLIENSIDISEKKTKKFSILFNKMFPITFMSLKDKTYLRYFNNDFTLSLDKLNLFSLTYNCFIDYKTNRVIANNNLVPMNNYIHENIFPIDVIDKELDNKNINFLIYIENATFFYNPLNKIKKK